MTLWLQECGLNATENYWCYGGRDVLYDTGCDTPGEVYHQIVRSREYGRCIGKVYVDVPGTEDAPSGVIAVGWVFQKREQYRDSKETFVKETWFTLVEKPEGYPPLKTVSIGKVMS